MKHYSVARFCFRSSNILSYTGSDLLSGGKEPSNWTPSEVAVRKEKKHQLEKPNYPGVV